MKLLLMKMLVKMLLMKTLVTKMLLMKMLVTKTLLMKMLVTKEEEASFRSRPGGSVPRSSAGED